MSLVYPLALLLIMACSPVAHAVDLWGPQGFAGFSNALPAATESSLRDATRNYWPVLQHRAGLDPVRIRVAKFKDIDPLLDRASRSALGTLELFTQKDLADPSARSLFLDGATLRQIDAKYSLNGIWMISARTLQPDHRPMRMDYMIVGQGRLIIGYPYESPVEIMDEGKSLEYRYEPFLEANIVNNGARSGLFGIRALNNPAGEFLPFRGPMGAIVQSLQVEGDAVVVNYHLGFDRQAHSDKTPIVVKPTHLAHAS